MVDQIPRSQAPRAPSRCVLSFSACRLAAITGVVLLAACGSPLAPTPVQPLGSVAGVDAGLDAGLSHGTGPGLVACVQSLADANAQALASFYACQLGCVADAGLPGIVRYADGGETCDNPCEAPYVTGLLENQDAYQVCGFVAGDPTCDGYWELGSTTREQNQQVVPQCMPGPGPTAGGTWEANWDDAGLSVYIPTSAL